MTRRQKHEVERAERLERAEATAGSLDEQADRVEHQVSFAGRLAAGWRRVHERNNLARLFRDEGNLG